MRRLRKNKKGFTLVELIVVIVILGILLAVLVPGVMTWVDKARQSQLKANARTAYLAAETVLVEAYGSGTVSPPEGVTELNQMIEEAGLDETYIAAGSITGVKLGDGEGIDRFRMKSFTFQSQNLEAKLENNVWSVKTKDPLVKIYN